MDLNEDEAEIYRFICEELARHTRPPTVREIADACFISRTKVSRYLDRLELRGYILRDRKARGILLTDKKPRL